MKCKLMKKVELEEKDLDFETIERYVESNHFDLYLTRCRKCGQLYVGCFVEVLDYEQGLDDCWVFYLPVSQQQANKVRERTILAKKWLQKRRHITRHPEGLIFWSDWPEMAIEMGPYGMG